jgi:hypothetical protein
MDAQGGEGGGRVNTPRQLLILHALPRKPPASPARFRGTDFRVPAGCCGTTQVRVDNEGKAPEVPRRESEVACVDGAP